jgi:hypothetical protein
MRIGIALHESHTEVIDHFCRVSNSAQNHFSVETVELTSAEEETLEPRDIKEADEEKIEHGLFEMKIAHGYTESDLFIVFFDGRLLGGPDEAPYFLWTSGLGEDDPGVALISLNYLEQGGVLDVGHDYSFVARSIEANVMCAVALMATSLHLGPPAPMELHGRLCGRVGRRRAFFMPIGNSQVTHTIDSCHCPLTHC